MRKLLKQDEQKQIYKGRIGMAEKRPETWNRNPGRDGLVDDEAKNASEGCTRQQLLDHVE